MDGETFRLFVCVDLSDPVRRELALFQSELREVRGLRMPPLDRVHLTLAFLGDTFVRAIPSIRAALGEAASRCAPFTFAVSGAGVFGPAHAPRVVWAGVPACPALGAAQAGVERAIQACGAAAERREFRPHVTVARCRADVDVGALTTVLRSFRSHAFGTVNVDRIRLMRSVLDQDPPLHLVLAALPLKGVEVHAPESPGCPEG